MDNNLDVSKIRSDFPLLTRRHNNGEPLIYLDSAATALKPQCVIDAVTDALSYKTSNIHRSVHILGDEATEAYESTRDLVAAFLNADINEIVFVRNTTEAINLVAQSRFGYGNVLALTSEHHSNLLPWHNASDKLDPLPDGSLDLEAIEKTLSNKKIDLVAVTQASNVTGAVTDIKKIVDMAHRNGAKVLVDAAQSAPHMPIDVDSLNCDFLAFSGHKLGAPTGVGVLYGKSELLESMDFYLRGGSTIEEIIDGNPIPKNAPWKLEAGTPAIESVIGLGAAIDYLLDLDMENIQAHFQALSNHLKQEIEKKLSLDLVLGDKHKDPSGPYSLVFKGLSPHLLARGLSDRYGICVRSGFHCAQPLHQTLQTPASLRISYWIYNTPEELSFVIDSLDQLIKVGSR